MPGWAMRHKRSFDPSEKTPIALHVFDDDDASRSVGARAGIEYSRQCETGLSNGRKM